MSFWKKIFGGGGSTADPQPFMEHPSGDFDNVVAAMEDAVKRLRKLPKWDQWITFGAQGKGDKPESYEFAEVRRARTIPSRRPRRERWPRFSTRFSGSISAFARFPTRATITPSERNGRERQMKDLFREANLR
jgi:hypothetical protein